MSRLAIDKALLKGNAKQRATLLANHIAEAGLEGSELLTRVEVDALTNSFKTDREVNTYRRYKRAYDQVRYFIPTILHRQADYWANIERLEKLISFQRNNYDFEDMINSLIDLMPDKKTKAVANERIKDFTNPAVMRLISFDKEGYAQISSKKNLLSSFIDESRKEAEKSQVDLKTAITLVKDVIAETGINIRVFTAMIKETENWAKSKKGLTNLKFKNRGDCMSKDRKEILNKEEIEKPYAEVEIDQEQYKKWKGDFFE